MSKKKQFLQKMISLKKIQIAINRQPLAAEPSNFAQVLVTLMWSYGEKLRCLESPLAWLLKNDYQTLSNAYH